MTKETLKNKPIRSFVIRGGRMTAGQQKSWDALWPNRGMDLSPSRLDFSEVFGNKNPLVLEIGFGMGRSLCEMAQQAPDINFVGIEVHRPGVGALLMKADELELNNLKVFCADANELIKHSIADNALNRLQLYFPDPWHKKKHNKRRLVKPEFVQSIRPKLEVGGIFHMATDWEHYAEQMMEVMEEAEGFKNISGKNCFSERPDYRPLTKFEERGQRLGHGVWDLLFERIS